MMKKFFFLLIAGLILAGGILLSRPLLVLEVVNTTRKGPVWAEPVSRFNLSYINSIYLQPATEEFEAGDAGEIILRAVKTPSAAVAQYYGFEDGRTHYPVNRRMKSFALRIGMSRPQTVEIGERKISLRDWGQSGDRLEFSVVRLSAAHYACLKGLMLFHVL